MSEIIGGKRIEANHPLAHLKRFLDPVVEEDIVDEVEELDKNRTTVAVSMAMLMILQVNKRQLMEKV